MTKAKTIKGKAEKPPVRIYRAKLRDALKPDSDYFWTCMIATRGDASEAMRLATEWLQDHPEEGRELEFVEVKLSLIADIDNLAVEPEDA